jgi:hypothetical protein
VGVRESERLVRELARDLVPVRRIPRLRVVALLLAAGALCLSALVVSVLGLRPDVRAGTASASYLGIVAGLGLFSLGGLVAALGASVPGRAALVRAGLAALAAAVALWMAALVAQLGGGARLGPLDSAWLGTSARCLLIATGVGMLPALALLRFVGSAFAVNPRVAVGIGAAGMVAFGSLSVHLTCSADEVLHVATAHLMGPLVVGALLALLLGVARRVEPTQPAWQRPR